MTDFTSALYLGMRHGSASLGRWNQLTIGRPAALGEPSAFRAVATGVAELQGCERGVMAASTLHVFWDLISILAGSETTIFLDSGAYPIARWGVERAAARGARVICVPHYDADFLSALQRKRDRRPVLRNHSRGGAGPPTPHVVVADGICPSCGRTAPVRDYLEILERHGGLLVMDDTQAFGILGSGPTAVQPYGYGGGGILRWSAVRSPRVIVVSSLAKAFGTPMAVLSGPRSLVKLFEESSETRLHASPPSRAVASAAGRALRLNAVCGDRLRERLLGVVRAFRSGLGWMPSDGQPGVFPVQSLACHSMLQAFKVSRGLLRQGIRVLSQRSATGSGVKLGFLLRADHSMSEVAFALAALRETWSTATSDRVWLQTAACLEGKRNHVDIS